ncbi:MAG TPA: oxidoreductase [Verrucomicrobiales bacterium]|nr:oxidoreductase [Verrucomicrobiales bacterium]
MAKKFSKTYVSRRSFIGTAAASAFTFNFFPKRVFGANDRIAFAGIGVGGKGSGDIDQAGNLGDVVALCDIDLTKLDAKGEKFAKAKKYKDFRKMLEEMHTEIDAVTISTPDHMHAPAGLLAMSLGKHVYCQKPLTHSVYEARRMGQVARQYKVATQMGNQGTASDGLRRGVEVIQSGAIGAVREVHVWTNRPVWPQAPSITARPNETPAIPNHVDWHLFLGVAPDRPYHNAYHPFKWRGWWDFGTGALGDMGCHIIDHPYWALKLGYPDSVEASSTHVHAETAPLASLVTYQFPAREGLPPVRLIWYDGGIKPPRPEELKPEDDWPVDGVLYVGERGKIMHKSHGGKPTLLPLSRMDGFQRPDETLPRVKGSHEQNWIDACKGMGAACSHFDYSGPLTEVVLLGNLAIRTEGHLLWDGPNMRVTNNEVANQWVQRAYRTGWKL